MRPARLDGVELKYDVVGSGEPLLLIHGGFIADTFLPLLAEPRIVSKYRAIAYHRRGYGGSSRRHGPLHDQTTGVGCSCAAPASGHPARACGGPLLRRCHRDPACARCPRPRSEPGPSRAALVALVPSGPTFLKMLSSVQAMHQRGDRAGATDAFLTGVMGREYRPLLEKALPPGTFELAVADSDTCFGVELEALQQWSFTAEDAVRIRQPVLSVIGDESGPIFDEIHSLLKQWLPHSRSWRFRIRTTRSST